MSKVNVLIVEDEPLIINSLEHIFGHLSNISSKLDFKIQSSRDCDSALLEINKAVKGTPLDLVLLDINIPASKCKELLSGEDLGIELKNTFPDVKIIVFTSHQDNYRLNNILQNLDPDGFIIKNEVGFNDIMKAISKVLTNPPYYSDRVLKLIRRHVSNEVVLDKIDRQLLYLLSKGTKTKDIPDYIRLSKSGVERRKRNLKEIFQIENKEDKVLLEIAIEKGFI
ncbi:response regulator [Pontimicrobium sp. SW4]|uniref:Response regulator n=1 Tax=Pontimicrobium sp. SW4 TaxID=3153519 RepID=A0AAU7BQ71_9FLAO